MKHTPWARTARLIRAMRSTLGPACIIAAVLLLALAASCVAPPPPKPLPPPPPPPPALRGPLFEPVPQDSALKLCAQISPAAQGFASWREIEQALRQSLRYVCAKPAQGKAVDRPGLALTYGALRATLEELLTLLPRLDQEPGLLAERFSWYAVRPETLLTGYYEPWLKASPVQVPEYPYPLYGMPRDLKTIDLGRFHPRWQGQTLTYRLNGSGIEPYHNREEIDFTGALKGKAPEIAWVGDMVDIYFLQVQGSGRLILPDGRVKHVLYAGKNGRELNLLGRTLIQRGLLTREEASAPRIRRFMAEHPELMRELLANDQSYVFFRLGDEGPFGSMGGVLSPLASVAVDKSLVPLGAALLLDTDLPSPNNGQNAGRANGGRRLFGLVLAQDTGGAIKETRIDLFCGSGERAEFLAGHMKQRAQAYVLVSKAALAACPAK